MVCWQENPAGNSSERLAAKCRSSVVPGATRNTYSNATPEQPHERAGSPLTRVPGPLFLFSKGAKPLADSPMRVGDFTIERHYVRFVEAELRRHPHRKRRLSAMEDEIIRATPGEDLTGMPRGSGPGNPTMNQAFALMRNEERARLALMVRLVEVVFAELQPLQQDIIRLVYWDGRYTLEGALAKVPASRRTFFRRRNQALLAFALSLVGDHAVGTTTAPG